jgi:thiamine biosynthesis lipoprotein
MTEGALDITVRPLVETYRLAVSEKRKPTEAEVKAALAKVNYRHVSVSEDGRTVTVASDGMALDLSATAKGYAADEAAKVLQKNGIKHAFVEAGGDIRFVGPRVDGGPWTAGVQDPRGKQGDYTVVLELSEGAVCTSGNYAQGYWLGKERVSHIVDPRTGKPCDSNPSVTVFAPDALTADALATALSVSGKKGLALVEKLEGVEALVMSIENDALIEHRSTGFEQLVKKP